MFRLTVRTSEAIIARASSVLAIAVNVAAFWFGASVYGDTFYIGASGSNVNNGTSADSPWGTFGFAFGQLAPGDTLLVLDGTYNINTRVQWQSGGGTMGSPINVWAAPGAAPVLDFNGMTATWGSTAGRGIEIAEGVDWLHFKGLTIQNARDNGINSKSDHSIFEQLVTRSNGDSGLQIDGFSQYNLVLNCDSYLNYDPSANGENADGFAVKFADLGPGNVVRGSRAWSNSDDGWDMWESTLGGVLVEDSWSFDNGKLIQQFFDKDALELGDLDPSGSNFQGDGTGYKLGQDGGEHVLNRVLAWANRVGIDVNGNANGVTVNNSTAYNNTRNWQFDENLATHVLRNNISLAGVNTTLSDVFFAAVDDAFNSWNPGVGTTTAADFVSLVDTLARGPRQADGSLPVIDFLHLLGNSDLIDKGTNVGLLYIGQAPDLGAFETAVDDFWRSAASGTWSAGLNWEDSSTPTASNTANFNESGTYTVTFDANPDAIRALIVSAGSVTFASSGGARTLPVNSAGGTGDVRIDGGATLTLGTSGNPLHLTIGDELAIESGATLNINHSSQVTPGGNVTVDGGVLAKDSATSMLTLGTGKTLTIENGGRASFTGGYSTNNAVYNVSGAASRMETLAGGTLSINNGAIVNVTAGGLLSSAGNLGVGTSGANGILLVDGSDSSVVASGTLNIWGASGGSASVTFSNNATGTFAGELRMTFPLGGGSPSASLHVLSGADVVVMDSISVASFGGLTSSATLNVQGAGSSLTQTDSLTIGHTSAGTAVVNVGTTDSGATFTNVDGPVTINATGTLSIGSATTSGTFDAGGAMTVLGTVNLAGGAMFARNTLTIDPAGDFNFTGGTLHAVEIVGSLASSGGTLEPGFSTAALTISGAYAQSAASKLRLELGGASPGSQFDHILVGGAATLAGALEISLVDSFAPGLGDSFEILHADGGVFGSFATSSLPPLPAALSWHVVYSASAVLLQVVLPGDYNDDGKVDAADYVVWRKNEGTTTPLPNDPIGGMIGLDQLNQWRANFGETGGSGAGSSINPAEATVPEPATLALLLAAVFVGYGLFAGRGSQCQIRFLS